MQIISGIYKIENLINHNIYIGQSCNIYSRWYSHKNIARKADKLIEEYEYPLYKAMRKYGIDNFSFEIIEEIPYMSDTDREILNRRE